MPTYCINEDCEIRACFGKRDSKLAEYCFNHKLDGYVNVKNKKCLLCNKTPTFGIKGSKLAEYCKKHKLDGYIDVRSKTCLKCDKIPNFGKKGTKLREYCKQHAPEDYIDIKHKTCLKCNKQPTFGKKGTKLREYCKQHAPEDYIDIKNKTCLKCNKRPNFGKKGGRAKYCKQHAPEDYIDITHKTCLLCNKRPAFGKKGGRAKYCSAHKLDSYIDVVSKTCLLCDKYPAFGKKGTKLVKYCKSHAPEDYVNVKDKTCLKCDKHPAFGIKGERAKYCKTHAPDDYVNIKGRRCLLCNKLPTFGKLNSKLAEYCKAHSPEDYVDVKNKICLLCPTRASYGPLFQPKRHCAKHKTHNEFIKNNPKCSGDKCKNEPIFTKEDSIYPIRCEDHKLEDDINIVEKECQSCKLPWIIPENQTMCLACREFNIPSIRNRKENKIKDMLNANNIEYQSHDAIVDIQCSKKRPDFVLDYGFYKVVIEVDENQHKSYPCECEQSRMIQIHQDIGMDLLFIRFNPDSYLDSDKKRIRSYTGREKRLLELLNSLKNTEKRSHYLEVIYMYYDGWDNVITKIDVNYMR